MTSLPHGQITTGPAAKVVLKAEMLRYALNGLDEMEVVTDYNARLIRDVRAAFDDLSSTLETLREELHLISRVPISFNTNEYIDLRRRIDNLFIRWGEEA